LRPDPDDRAAGGGGGVEADVRPTVLIAGPSISEGLEIRGWLSDLDCHVVLAGSAREIMRHASHRSMDLLILDTSLPDMEGAKLIPLIQEIHPGLPIIATTGNHSPDLEQAVRRCQIVYYAIRPDDLPHLGEVARKNLDGALSLAGPNGDH
jgi:DNA-binding NtrC family response regulator